MNEHERKQLAEWQRRKALLKAARKSAGLDVYDLSLKCGLRPVLIDGFERGVSVPSLAEWVAMYSVLPDLPRVPLTSWVMSTTHNWKKLGWTQPNVCVFRPENEAPYAEGRKGARLDYFPQHELFTIRFPDGRKEFVFETGDLRVAQGMYVTDPMTSEHELSPALIEQFGHALSYVCIELRYGTAAGHLPFINGEPTLYIDPDELRASLRGLAGVAARR